ncbi:hypothetical protein DsansV1_C01g0002451 [Dioscorea sansibarensis]
MPRVEQENIGVFPSFTVNRYLIKLENPPSLKHHNVDKIWSSVKGYRHFVLLS